MSIFGNMGTKIKSKISESEARVTKAFQDADTKLNTLIDDNTKIINQEINDRKLQDNQLNDKIIKEATDRENADALLLNLINNNKTDIKKEKDERLQSEKDLNDKIIEESDARKSEDKKLNDLIILEQEKRISEDNSIKALIQLFKEEVEKTYLDKVKEDNQKVNSNLVEFQNIKINGELLLDDNAKTVLSEKVLIKDNIITLNSNLTENDIPTEDSGFEINRGKEGISTLIKWDEINKKVLALVKLINGELAEREIAYKFQIDNLEKALKDSHLECMNNMVEISTKYGKHFQEYDCKIDKFISDFNNNISNIQNALDNLDSKIILENKIREKEILELTDEIKKEISDRKEDISKLYTTIEIEKNRAITKENMLSKRIDSEYQRAIAAEGDLKFNPDIIDETGKPASNLTEAINDVDRFYLKKYTNLSNSLNTFKNSIPELFKQFIIDNELITKSEFDSFKNTFNSNIENPITSEIDINELQEKIKESVFKDLTDEIKDYQLTIESLKNQNIELNNKIEEFQTIINNISGDISNITNIVNNNLNTTVVNEVSETSDNITFDFDEVKKFISSKY